MTHLFKVPLENSDMFVKNITDEHIVYSIRDGKGKLLEPEVSSKYKEANGKVQFDSRFIAKEYFDHIKMTLQ